MAYLIDTTLRDGEQAPGVSFSAAEKLKIATMLCKAGITEAEVGTPAISDEEVDVIREILALRLDMLATCWVRATKFDLDRALATGAKRVNVSFPVSSILLDTIQKDRDWLYATMHEMLSLAADRFEFVAVGIQDASRIPMDVLSEFVLKAASYPVQRVRIADTVGVLNPHSTQVFVSETKKLLPYTELEFHAHNDFGLATANSLVAMYAGADCVSLTIGGLGERAGNAALEEVVAALKYSYDTDTRYDLKLCSELVEYVAAASCRPIPIAKPIVGAMAFSHESGIHCRSLTQNPVSYQAFRPADIGKTTQFVLGKHSGRHTLIQYLEQHGLHHLSPKAEQILKEVKLQASLKKSALEDWEILKLIQVFSRGL